MSFIIALLEKIFERRPRSCREFAGGQASYTFRNGADDGLPGSGQPLPASQHLLSPWSLDVVRALFVPGLLDGTAKKLSIAAD